MSKDLYQLMREQEIATSNFLPTKREIQTTSLNFAKKLIEDGNENIQEKFAQCIRLKEAFTTIESELKKSLPNENFEAFGLKGTYRSGGSIANYDEDIVYASIKKQLEDRKTLLDTALSINEEFYDSEGILIPKVSKTERKSSLAISF